VVVREYLGEQQLGRTRRRRNDNIKMNLREICFVRVVHE
jgi:hypothetical protein